MGRKVAIIACAVGLPGEKGYSRFPYLANMLCEKGFDVDLYTSTFNHWEKAQRDKNDVNRIQDNVPYNIILSYEPGYKKNVDLKRIISHRKLAKNIIKLLQDNHRREKYDLLYVIIPDNKLAADVSEFGRLNSIPVIIDIEDLWPEGMEQIIPIPKWIGKIAFFYFRKKAKIAYRNASAYVGTSDEFRDEPLKYHEGKEKPRITVYVGCDLNIFDTGVKKYSSEIEKTKDEFWIIYTGTLGSSYDIGTLIKAAQQIKALGYNSIKFKILGGGPLKEQFETIAKEKPCEVEFLGYVQYEKMAAYLSKSDITVNSFIKSAPQSIVNKVGDYLAAGKPMINTLSSLEFRNKVKNEGFGLNVWGGDVNSLSDAILNLYRNSTKCTRMGHQARLIADEQFDRAVSYMKIIELINGVIILPEKGDKPHETFL